MANERITENIVRESLRELGYTTDREIRVEEQKSGIEAVKRLLKSASKSGLGGSGAPEFIISAGRNPDYLLVIECKASVRDHISDEMADQLAGRHVEETTEQTSKRIKRYAVDGVLHYAQYLAKEYNVIAVAVSGESRSAITISSYLVTKGSLTRKSLVTKENTQVEQLLPWDTYIEYATFDPHVQRLRFDELMAFSRDLHDFMRDHAKLTESEKPLLVSGTLIALRNDAFRGGFDKYTSAAELQREWYHVIQNEIRKADIPNSKKENMAQPYSSIAVHPELGKATPRFPRGVLYELIKLLYDHVWPYVSVYHDFDVVGQFYGEFLKYTGGDKKALGIVLTPRHITELFALLANLQGTSRILDSCCGTGGFLIAGMNYMMSKAVTDVERQQIRKHGLVGVEQQPSMYALAASNMILRGDGKANLYQGSCFDEAIIRSIKEHACDCGMMNPPYSQKDEDARELVFVKYLLDALKLGGTGIVIVPMSCAIVPNPIREELLKYHTLDAVMSMPDELFYPVGTVTCIMVFTAHIPHAQSARKTWFGYWKDDGFIKTKHRGRIDAYQRWPTIRDRWVEQYRNREVHAGESVTQYVTHEDEWCAEAYMETDYSTLTQADFERVVKNYALFSLLGASLSAETDAETDEEDATA